MSGAPVVVTGDVPVLGTREMSPSLSDAQPNFHMTDQPPSKQASPSASPRILISFKGDQGGGGGPSEPDSPASINHDAPPSTQPGDSNSASTSANSGASQSLAPSAVSIPATTLNMPVGGSISQPVPLSPSRRPFSFRDVTDINEDSQIRVQSARVHHDEYDRKRTCACCEKRTEQENTPEPEIKQPNPATTSTTEAHATNGKPAEKDKDKDKTTDKNKSANGTSPTSPSSSSSRAKKPKSSGWGFCGLCLAFRNCMSPEDTEYRCEHGRPCTAANHRHTKGC